MPMPRAGFEPVIPVFERSNAASLEPLASTVNIFVLQPLPHHTFTLKMATAIFVETLEKLQQSTRLIPKLQVTPLFHILIKQRKGFGQNLGTLLRK
jgi:hypothetical protein